MATLEHRAYVRTRERRSTVRATVKYGSPASVDLSRDPADWRHESTPWTVDLRYRGRALRVPFWTGRAITADPTAADVLDCLLSDASGAEQSFEDWAADLGCDPDSRKAEATYRAVIAQTAKLRRLLGEDFGAATRDPESWVHAHTVRED